MFAYITLRQANELVRDLHRHSAPVVGHKFSRGLFLDGRLVGAIIVGRPVSRQLAARGYLEVTRCVTDGTPNACSRLYADAWRIVRQQGLKLCTYIRADEPGSSLRAAGWSPVHYTRPEQWSRSSRPRPPRELIGRWRYEPPQQT